MLFAISISSLEAFPELNRSPERMNRGIASMVKEFIPAKNLGAVMDIMNVSPVMNR
jgi:hypothetical protein